MTTNPTERVRQSEVPVAVSLRRSRIERARGRGGAWADSTPLHDPGERSLARTHRHCRELAAIRFLGVGRAEPLVERKAALRNLLVGGDHRLVFVDHVAERGEELFAGARALRLEGIVAKRADSPYVPGRSDHWRKMKVEETDDFVVIGIGAPTRKTFDRPSLILACAGERALRYVGRVAVNRAELAALDALVPQLRCEEPVCNGAGRAEMWLQPAVVCEVRFLASSQRGLRHAALIRWRPDKTWVECRDSVVSRRNKLDLMRG